MQKALLGSLLIIVLPVLSFALPPLEVHFIDVGQGDAILFKAQNDVNILIDTGCLSGAHKLKQYLKCQKVAAFKAILITHFHQDHVGGLFSLFPEFTVQKIYDNGVAVPADNFWVEYIIMIDELKLSRAVLKRGGSLKFGDLNIDVLNPPDQITHDINTDSLAFKISYGNVKFLMAGDMTLRSEQRLFSENFDLQGEILKVGHHGAADATSERFLQAVNPQIAVVCVGENNRFGYPSPEVINRIKKMNIRLFRTDIDGTVVVKTDGKKITAFSERLR